MKKEIKRLGSYRVEVISLPEELELTTRVPLEIKYVLKQRPDLQTKIIDILKNGKAIGIRTITKTPENILNAIRCISEQSQHNCVLTWLPYLLRDNHLPVFTENDIKNTEINNKNLNEAVETITRARLSFKKFVLIDEENVGISDEERRLMIELSEIINPLAIDTIIHRTIIDNANERTEVAQTILKALFIIGPIAHFLEKFASGVGKVFAASTDDLLGEAAELMALRGSGFTWKVLSKRFYLLVPVFGLATYGAFQVEPLIEHGRVALAGTIFGFSAVALSLTTALQSIRMYMISIRSLRQENKMHSHKFSQIKKSDFIEAVIQDFTNPARLGLLIGALCAPIFGMFAALLGLMDNGWVLAAVGSTESIIAGITVMSASHINEWKFSRTLKKRLS